MRGVDVPPVVGHAIAFDSLRNRVVSYGGGGNVDGQFTDHTWVFDGVTWTRVFTLHSPPPCAEARNMAYDSQRDRIVKFGGFTADPTRSRETWEFDGTDWSQRATTGPQFDSNMFLVYDSARHKTVLFGGTQNSGVVVAETWEWDGVVWTQRTPAHSPAAGTEYAMVYDPIRQRTYMYGGRTPPPGNLNLNDLWEWDGNDWTLRSSATFPVALLANMVFDSNRGQVFLCGNPVTGAAYQNWTFDGINWTQLTEPPNTICPTHGASPNMAFLPHIDKVLATFPDGAINSTNSRSYTFGISTPPVIFEQPLDLIVPIGGQINEAIATTCVAGRTYRWRHNGNNLSDIVGAGTGISGAANSSISIYGSTVTTARSGNYDCVVNSACGTTISQVGHVTVTCDVQHEEFVFDPAPVTFTINFGGATYTFTFQLAGVARVTLDPSCTAATNPRTLRGSIDQLDLRTEPPVIVLPDFLGGTASLNNARLVIGGGLGDPGSPGLLSLQQPFAQRFSQSGVEPDLLGSFGYSIGTLVGTQSLSSLVFQPVDWTFSLVPRGTHTLTLPFTGTWTVDSGMGPDNPTFTMQSTLTGRRVTRCGRADIAALGGFALPDGQLTADDIIVFLDAYFRNIFVVADLASLGGVAGPDGRLTADDVIEFLAAFFAGCP